MNVSNMNIVAWIIATGCVLAFLLVAWRDIALLLRRPEKLGTGVSRIWAVARTAFIEAWSVKAWGIIILWLVVSIILLSVIRPHDETEVFELYVPVLIRGQEFLMLILMLVLACFSLPRERERRTIITTGAKPLSRLELFLGKVVGFSTMTLLLLGIMSLLSLGILNIANYRVKAVAQRQYEKEQLDYEKGISGRSPPSQALKKVAEEGLLQAGNYITVKRGGMQVAGEITFDKDNKPIRFLKGGSEENLLYRFPAMWANPAARPSLLFQFGVKAGPGLKELPAEVELNCMLVPASSSMLSAIQEKQVTLRHNPAHPAGFLTGQWWPDPTMIFGYGGDAMPVNLKINCSTPGVYLQIAPTTNVNDANIIILDVDPAKHDGSEYVAPQFAPYILGFEKRDMQQIAGPDFKDPGNSWPEVASWTFTKIRPEMIPATSDGDDTFELAMYLEIEKQRNNEAPTEALVTAYNMFMTREPVAVRVNVEEKRRTSVKLPRSLLAADSDLIIDVRCLTPGHWIGGKDDSLRLEQPSSSFLVNLLKSEGIIFCEVSLLIVIAVACSIRLGGAVAMLTAAMAYFLGYIREFINEVAREGSNAIFSPYDQQQMKDSLIFNAFNMLTQGITQFVAFLTHLLPDFTRFDPTAFIADSRNIPWLIVGTDVLFVVIYALPFVALGYLMIRKQELA